MTVTPPAIRRAYTRRPARVRRSIVARDFRRSRRGSGGRQLVAFNRIVQAVQEAKAAAGHAVVLVQGAPGTGKSVIAIQLLAHGARQGWKVLHATGSQAFQTNLRGKTIQFADEMHQSLQGTTKKKDLPVRDLFCTFADVAKAGAKGAEPQHLVVADEAHRLWEHRRIKFPNGRTKRLTDTPMIEEVIRGYRASDGPARQAPPQRPSHAPRVCSLGTVCVQPSGPSCSVAVVDERRAERLLVACDGLLGLAVEHDVGVQRLEGHVCLLG